MNRLAEKAMPSSRPRKPASSVARFQNMPKQDSGQQRRDEDAEQRLHVIHDAVRVHDQ